MQTKAIRALETLGVSVPKPIAEARQAVLGAAAMKKPAEPKPITANSSDAEILAHIAQERRCEVYKRSGVHARLKRAERAEAALRAAVNDNRAELTASVIAEANKLVKAKTFDVRDVERFDALMQHARRLAEGTVSAVDAPLYDVALTRVNADNAYVYDVRHPRASARSIHGPALWFKDAPEGLEVNYPPTYQEAVAAGSPLDLSNVEDLARELSASAAKDIVERVNAIKRVDWRSWDYYIADINSAADGAGK